jgi:hypothetical protein
MQNIAIMLIINQIKAQVRHNTINDGNNTKGGVGNSLAYPLCLENKRVPKMNENAAAMAYSNASVASPDSRVYPSINPINPTLPKPAPINIRIVAELWISSGWISPNTSSLNFIGIKIFLIATIRIIIDDSIIAKRSFTNFG